MHGFLALNGMQGRIEVQYGDQDNAISDCSVGKQYTAAIIAKNYFTFQFFSEA